jgi:hypothetical protein
LGHNVPHDDYKGYCHHGSRQAAHNVLRSHSVHHVPHNPPAKGHVRIYALDVGRHAGQLLALDAQLQQGRLASFFGAGKVLSRRR